MSVGSSRKTDSLLGANSPAALPPALFARAHAVTRSRLQPFSQYMKRVMISKKQRALPSTKPLRAGPMRPGGGRPELNYSDLNTSPPLMQEAGSANNAAGKIIQESQMTDTGSQKSSRCPNYAMLHRKQPYSIFSVRPQIKHTPIKYF